MLSLTADQQLQFNNAALEGSDNCMGAIAHGVGKGKQMVKQVLPGFDSNEIVP